MVENARIFSDLPDRIQRVYGGDNVGWKIGLEHFQIILG